MNVWQRDCGMLRLAAVNWRSARCIRAARFCWKRFPNMTRVPTFVCGVPSSWKAPRRLSEQGLEIVKARLDKVEIVWKLKYYHFSDVLRNILAFHLSTSTPLLSHLGHHMCGVASRDVIECAANSTKWHRADSCLCSLEFHFLQMLTFGSAHANVFPLWNDSVECLASLCTALHVLV